MDSVTVAGDVAYRLACFWNTTFRKGFVQWYIYQLFQRQIRIPLPNLHLKRKTHPVSEEMPFRAPSMNMTHNVLSTSRAYFSLT